MLLSTKINLCKCYSEENYFFYINQCKYLETGEQLNKNMRKMHFDIFLYTAISIKVVPEQIKRKSRIRALDLFPNEQNFDLDTLDKNFITA
jgi:hypothetical protein